MSDHKKKEGPTHRTIMARVEKDGLAERTIMVKLGSERPDDAEPRGKAKIVSDSSGLEWRGDYLIRRDGEKDLKFNAEVVAAVSSQGNGRFGERARSWIGNGMVARWRELIVYHTKGNATVCHEARMSKNAGEVDKHRAIVIPDDGSDKLDSEKVIAFFGRDALAKRLYDDLRISDAEEIA